MSAGFQVLAATKTRSKRIRNNNGLPHLRVSCFVARRRQSPDDMTRPRLAAVAAARGGCAIRCSPSARSRSSEGLESAAASGLVTGRPACGVAGGLPRGRVRSPGRSGDPLVWSAVDVADWDALVSIDAEPTALRVSSTARRANRAMGLRLLKTWHGLHPDVRLERLLALGRRASRTDAPGRVSAVCHCGGTPWATRSPASPIRASPPPFPPRCGSMAIGQTDAHRLFSLALTRVPATIEAFWRGRRGRNRLRRRSTSCR